MKKLIFISLGILFVSVARADIASTTYYKGGTGISVSDGTISSTTVSQVRNGSSTSTTMANMWIE